MFAVLVRIDNREGLLRPGMNTEVEVHVGRREHVPAVPNAALRTQRDVGSAAQVLGLSVESVQQQLAASSGRTASSAGASPRTTDEETAGPDSTRRAGRDSLRGARPDSMRGMRSDSARPRRGQFGGGGRASRATDAGRYIVFAKRNGVPTPVWIRTGLTDLDYSEVLDGLQPGDSVYVLPSASLIQSQQDMRQRMNQITGGGAVPGMQQQPTGGARSGGGGASGGGAAAPPGR